MRKSILLMLAVAMSFSVTGCTYLGGETNLAQAAADVGFTNITTGDGTFENYQAVGHYYGNEFGLAVGVLWFKLFEVFPVQSNEELVAEMARQAQADGANAMINVTPHDEMFMPIILPFIGGIGVYWDRTEGTGIKTR